MSTRCRIAIAQEDATYHSIYGHYDGYNDRNGVGPHLRRHHASECQAKALIALGDISYLNDEVVCAYHRDRGESWMNVRPQISQSREALMTLAKASDANYLYLFESGEWQVLTL